jgi:hypothetical protein
MTPLAKFLLAVTGIGILVAATVALRPHPTPAVERAKLTPSQLVEIQQPKVEQPKPEPPKVVRPEPEEDDFEDGSGS